MTLKRRTLKSDVATIEAQVEAPQPKRGAIQEAPSSMQLILHSAKLVELAGKVGEFLGSLGV